MPVVQPTLRIALSTAIILAVMLLAVGTPTQSAADEQPKTCSAKAVTVRGDPSKFEWIARTKAKANWRAKVRAITGLGDPYANWNRAENRQEECDAVPNGTVCEFTGIPCRKGLPAEQPAL